MSLSHLEPSTWMSHIRNPMVIFKEEIDISKGFDLVDRTFEKIIRLRPITSTAAKTALDKILACKKTCYFDSDEEVETAPTLALAELHGVSSTMTVQKLTDYHLLRFELCKSAEKLGKPLPVYKEECDGLFMRVPACAEITANQVTASAEVAARLMNELTVNMDCVHEAQVWLVKEKPSDPKVHKYIHTYVWRLLSLAVVVAQCLLIVLAYHQHASSTHKDWREHVGVVIAAEQSSALALILPVHVIVVPRIHA